MSERLSDSDIQEMLSGFDVTRMVGRALVELQERRAADKQEPQPEPEPEPEPKPLSGVALAEAACKACGIEVQPMEDYVWIGRQFAPHVKLPDALWLWGTKANEMWKVGRYINQTCDGIVVWKRDVFGVHHSEILGTGPEAICRALVDTLEHDHPPGAGIA